MSGPFAHLCTGEETVADVICETHHFDRGLAEDIGDYGPAPPLIQDEVPQHRLGPMGRRWTGIAVAFAWRAYRASKRSPSP